MGSDTRSFFSVKRMARSQILLVRTGKHERFATPFRESMLRQPIQRLGSSAEQVNENVSTRLHTVFVIFFSFANKVVK